MEITTRNPKALRTDCPDLSRKMFMHRSSSSLLIYGYISMLVQCHVKQNWNLHTKLRNLGTAVRQELSAGLYRNNGLTALQHHIGQWWRIQDYHYYKFSSHSVTSQKFSNSDHKKKCGRFCDQQNVHQNEPNTVKQDQQSSHRSVLPIYLSNNRNSENFCLLSKTQQ